jgi:hypothetical protein
VGAKLSLVYREKGAIDTGAILLEIKTTKLMTGFETGSNDLGGLYSMPYKWVKP